MVRLVSTRELGCLVGEQRAVMGHYTINYLLRPILKDVEWQKGLSVVGVVCGRYFNKLDVD